jgi:transposase-like protein
MKTKEEFRIQPSYSEEFKRKIVKEIITGKYSKKESMSFYGLSWKAIYSWLDKYGQNVILEEGIETITLKKSNNMPRKNKITESQKVEELRKRIKELEAQLQEAELRARLNDKMIDIAEEQFKIPIRKKYVTRRSPKSRNSK